VQRPYRDLGSNCGRSGKKPMKPKELEQVKQLLKRVVTVDELAEVQRAIEETKGKMLLEPGMGFWEGKTPCWEMFRCPEAIKKECPAYSYLSLPCWEIEGTYCKLYDYRPKGGGPSICRYCRVYQKWGHGEPIEIKLFGKGVSHRRGEET